MSQYRSILKATSIFGGTQLLSMLVTIVRSKFVAILIGSAGMGLSSMYMSSLTMIITIFGLGLGSSVVRELSTCYIRNDMGRFSLIASVYKRILLVMSVLGTIFVILMSSLLSVWAFNTKDYTLDYCLLSLIVFFTLLSSGNQALLVSKRRIKETASCGVIGSIVSLLTSVPLFYYLGLKGVVPGLILSTFANYLVTYIYARRLRVKLVNVSWNDIYEYGRSMVTLGVAMITTCLMGQFVTYLINISISRIGGLSDIGFFNSAMSITMQVIGMVYAAMAADYYPRLASFMGNKEKMNETINQQSEILLYLTVPILSMFMVLAPIVIHILLSDEFLIITSFIRIICIGMLLKTASYALGYTSFAKGDKKVYLLLEGGYANLSNLILSITFYYFWGLTGLAFSFVVNYMLYYIVISIVVNLKYGYEMSSDVRFLTFLSFMMLVCILVFDYVFGDIQFYVLSSSIALFLTIFYFYKLNKKIGLFQSIKIHLNRITS